VDPAATMTFFGDSVYLTSSAQLHLEALTTNLSRVYTLSPTFRAEKSLTRHHLAEFYMLEAELIDMSSLDKLMDFVELFLKTVREIFFKF
jgi:asparaginyl-tRNA synthetase